MIDVLDTIKQAYDKSTTQVDKIILNGKEYRISNVEYYDDTYLDGNIFGTAIGKNIDFEIENTIDLEGQEIEYLTGITTNGTIHWISLGKFIIQDVQSNNTTNISKVTATDYMLKTNIPYVSDLDYESGRVTLLNVLQEVCTKSGLTLATTSFTNSTFIVDSNQFTEETLNRQVIQAVAQVSGTVAKIRNNQLYLINPNTVKTVSKVFTLNNYKEAEIKRATHPINLVSLGMADIEGENITLRDETSIAKNGENSLVINDNPFAYTQTKREQLITALFNAVKGFEYKSYSFKNCQGLPYLETLDKIQFKDKEGNTYDSFIFRFNNKSPNGLESTIEAPSITKATVAYQNVPSALDIAKKTEIKVDKQNQTIQAVVEEINDIQSQVTDITTTQATLEGTEIKIDDGAEEPIIKLELDGHSTQETREGYNLVDFSSKGDFENDVLTASGTNRWGAKEFDILDIIKNNAGKTMYFSCESFDFSNAKGGIVQINYTQADTLKFFGVLSTAGKFTPFKIPEDTSDITRAVLNVYYNNTSEEGTTYTTTITKPMLALTENLPYEQYGASPSPDFPSEIQSLGYDVNLFDINTVKTSKLVSDTGTESTNLAWVLSDYIEVNQLSDYMFSWVSNSSFFQVLIISYDENKTFLNRTSLSTSGIYKKSFQTIENCKYIKINYSIKVDNIEVTRENIKLQKGTIATAYSEYGKGTVEIKQSGKNAIKSLRRKTTNMIEWYFDKNSLSNKMTFSAILNIDLSNATLYVKPTPTEAGTQLGKIDFKANIKSSLVFELSNELLETLKKGENGIFQIYYGGYDFSSVNINEVMVCEGQDLNYEPYKVNSYAIPLSQPLRSLPNGVKDTIEEDGIHRRVGSVVLDGSEDWKLNASTSDYYEFVYYSLNPNAVDAYINAISNYFSNTVNNRIICKKNSMLVRVPLSANITSVDEFKTWLSTHNVEVQYELSEEVIEPLTEEQQAVIDSISTILGTQCFTCDANMRITYVRNNGLSDMYETKQNATRKYAQQEMKLTETGALIESLVSVTNALNDGFKVGDEELQKKLEELGKSLEEYQLTTSTSFEQTEKNFQMKFNELIESINTNAEGNSEKFAEIVKYIRFEDGNIVLGRSDNELILKIQNDRISYQQNGSEVAYFSNNKLYVTTLEVTHSLQLGNFAFIPRANGNLSFKKVGGN